MPRIVFTLLLALAATCARAETWAERLGYDPKAKVLILHADEMGLAYETNAAGQALAEQGLVRSSSVMAPCPWFADFADWAREHENADVGLALTINSERPRYRWQPLASDDDVQSLVDQEGFLWPEVVQTTVNADVDEVARELHAQIFRARMAGLEPTHFTTHLGALFARTDLAQLYLRLSQQYWIPAVVVELTPQHIDRFRRMGFPLPQKLIDAVDAYPLPKVDDLQFVPAADSYEAKRQQFLDLIGNLPPGLTSVVLRPAIQSPALARIVDDADQRIWNAQLMQDPAVEARLNSPDVVLTTWREIMQRFEGKAAEGSSPTGEAGISGPGPNGVFTPGTPDAAATPARPEEKVFDAATPIPTLAPSEEPAPGPTGDAKPTPRPVPDASPESAP